jgi:TonB family protein
VKTNIIALVTLAFCVACDSVAAQDRAKALEAQAKRQVGRVARVCGVVASYSCPPSEGQTLLALETFPSKAGVSVAIDENVRRSLGLLFEPRVVLGEICATGLVEKREKRYLVVVAKPGELEVRELGTPGPSYPAGAVSTCDAHVARPRLLEEVKPAYTSEARAAGVRGIVLLEALVQLSGEVGDVRVLHSLDQGLDAQAVAALKAWRFSPGTYEGQPAPVVVTVEMAFKF